MSKIAVIADTHLPPEPDTLKDDFLDKALEEIRCNKPDLLLIAGDATSTGSLPALKRFSQKIETLPTARLSTVGNSDLRLPATNSKAWKILQKGGIKNLDDCTVVMLNYYDIEDDLNLLGDASRITGKPLLICSHFSLPELKTQIRDQVEKLLQNPFNIFVAGHIHENIYPGKDEKPQHLICGIDPDKAAGGPPCVSFFKTNNSEWEREDIKLDWLTPANWDIQTRQKLWDNLGFSAMNDPLGGLEYAAAQAINCVELRAFPVFKLDLKNVSQAVAKWRGSTPGSYLSIHLEDVIFNEDDIFKPNYFELEKSVELSVALEAEQVTVHLPGFDSNYQNNDTFFKKIIADYAEILRPLVDNEITIGFENMHLQPEETHGRFGCSPAEALKWINEFRLHTGYKLTGLHFDQGHARNNGIFGRDFNISQWYALTGHLITGYHLHQVNTTPEGMINHTEYISPYGKLIPLTSFFAAWHENIINHAPVFLEIRGEGIPSSLTMLRNYLLSAE